MSYVFPAAQCDLELSMQDKGMLNAAVYIGNSSESSQRTPKVLFARNDFKRPCLGCSSR